MENISIELKEKFTTNEEGVSYSLPIYRFDPEHGLIETAGTQTINFVRGSEDKTERRVGTLHEHLITVMIEDLKYKNKEVPSRETSLTITKLEEARNWMRQRQVDRKRRGVQGTDKE